jgi:pyridinium-3,5-biscarboxylic acid mononucleotide sulfurtransferase
LTANYHTLSEKYECLKRTIRELNGIVVAFSGGVDSSLLLKVAKDILGDNVLAVTADSPTMPSHERGDALAMAEEMGAEHLVIDSGEMGIAEFVKNPPNKCYICKAHRYGTIAKLAAERGFNFVADGENADDADDYRPGSKAAAELGIRSPLKECGLSKADVRVLSKELGLKTWTKAAYACLASRIPYGHEITEEKLRQVDLAEEFIRRVTNCKQVRVRHYDDTARVEVEPDCIETLALTQTRGAVINYLKQIGFQFITLDLQGYQMGSLNKALK